MMRQLLTIPDLNYILDKNNKTLEQLTIILEDENLYGITNIEDWVEVYNNIEYFLPLDVLDRVCGVN